jgi:hypothetical protein
MTRRLRTLNALADDLGSIPCTHLWVISICKTSSSGLGAFWPLQGPGMHVTQHQSIVFEVLGARSATKGLGNVYKPCPFILIFFFMDYTPLSYRMFYIYIYIYKQILHIMSNVKLLLCFWWVLLLLIQGRTCSWRLAISDLFDTSTMISV